MSEYRPKFGELNSIEDELLVAKLQAARLTITHAGEKGRAMEGEVRSLLRSILPSEYGLSTGFVVYHSPDGPRLSTQLDVIIFDAIRSSPIVSLETCDVFPLEAVFGYVEVKSTIQSVSDDAEALPDNSIEQCLVRNKSLRAMKDRRFWRPLEGSPVGIMLEPVKWMGIRSYVFAFEAQGTVAKNVPRLAQRMADYSKQLGEPTHLHGLFIANHGLLGTRAIVVTEAPPEDYYHVLYTTEHALQEFKTQLLRSFATFPRTPPNWVPATDQYFEFHSQWQKVAPR